LIRKIESFALSAPVEKYCPECNTLMGYRRAGYCWDGSIAKQWRCSNCWLVIWDGKRTWDLELPKGYFISFIKKYGIAPSGESMPPNEGVQLDLF
jgi:hypothetical protein